MGTQGSLDGVAQFPVPGGPSLATRCGTPPGSGLEGFYQTYYRNASASLCPPKPFNATQMLRIVW